MNISRPRTKYFNPRPPWGGRQRAMAETFKKETISIHALRGEGDGVGTATESFTTAFQSTPSVGRATQGGFFAFLVRNRFQSTPSVGRATALLTSPYKEVGISIHALRGEGDKGFFEDLSNTIKFQSTPSVGRATAKIYKYTILRLYIVHIKLYIFATAVLFT